MKILLAVDGSGHSEAAVHEVASRQLPAHSEVRIISAAHYVLIDDKLPILAAVKRIWGPRVTTIFPRLGHYALDPDVLSGSPRPTWPSPASATCCTTIWSPCSGRGCDVFLRPTTPNRHRGRMVSSRASTHEACVAMRPDDQRRLVPSGSSRTVLLSREKVDRRFRRSAGRTGHAHLRGRHRRERTAHQEAIGDGLGLLGVELNRKPMRSRHR